MRRLLGALAVAVATAACDGGSAGPGTGETSFGRIQSAVFDARCVACHSGGTQFAQQSGLVLTPGDAYGALVGVAPRQATALAEGLARVMPGKPDSSLLLHKLHWEPDHHAPDYGSPMPLGGPPLPVGQVEFVRRWIAAGAPTGGDTIDARLLADTTSQNLVPFEPLAPPAQGYQLRIERFPVAPHFERELFVYRRLFNATTAFVNRVETAMRRNSHHFVLYTFQDGTPASIIPPYDVLRDIRRPDGTLDFAAMQPMGYHVFFGGSMTERNEWTLPPGVALRLPPGAALDLNSHYVNRTDAELPGEVYANLHTVDSSAVQHLAHSLFLSNFEIVLPPRQRTTLSRTFLMSEPVAVFLLTSHMHERGERFVIRIVGGPRDGEIVFETTSWSAPGIVTFDPPIPLAAGQGLRSEITWNNTTDRTIRFGLTSEDEMGIIFGYFYCPAGCANPPYAGANLEGPAAR